MFPIPVDLLISLRCSTFRLAGGLVDRISQAALADMLHLERKNLNGVGLPVALALFEFTDGAAADLTAYAPFLLDLAGRS